MPTNLLNPSFKIPRSATDDPSSVGSLFVTMADSSTREYNRMSTKVSRSVSGSEILPYFGVDTHRYTLVLQFRMCLSSVQVPSLYVVPFLRYSCFPQFVPVKAVHDSNDRSSEGNDYISGTVQRINTGLAPLCC